MTVTAAPDHAEAIVRLAVALRGAQVPISLRDELDAAEALRFVDATDQGEAHLALRIALKIPRAAFDTFAHLFDRCWTRAEDPPAADAPPPPAPRDADPRHPPPAARRRLLSWDPVSGTMADARDGLNLPEIPTDGEQPSASAAVLLRRKSFDEATWSPQDLADMERILARLARRLAARRSRRLVPSRGRGRVDLRRSYRRALRTCGELIGFERRARALQEPRLVFLCDTSGSMDAHTRFLLAFVLSLRRVVRRAELFAFNTELVHLTPALAPGKVRLTLERLAAAVPDWSGGTRIGDSLSAFVAAGYLSRHVDGRTVVVILSDGLDRGDPAQLAAAVRRIAAGARKLIWVNPLAGDARYAPEAAGMRAALPFIDHFASAHNLESFERLLPHLAG